MPNPYQPPSEGSESREAHPEQIANRRKRRRAIIAMVCFGATSAIVAAGILLFSKEAKEPEVWMIASAGATLLHSAAWAFTGYMRFGWLGLFALFGIAFIAPWVLVFAFVYVSLLMSATP